MGYSRISVSFLVKFLLLCSFSAHATNFSVCFSPGGNCDEKLIAFANTATESVDIAIFVISLKNLSETLQDLNEKNIKIRVVADRLQAQTKASLLNDLSQAGIPVRIAKTSGFMHNKFMIVDGKGLETGSFNYSKNATKVNAENQIYLDDPTVISQYQEQFEKLWSAGTPN